MNGTVLIPQMLSSSGKALDGILFKAYPPLDLDATQEQASVANESALHWASLPTTRKLATTHNVIVRQAWVDSLSAEARDALASAGVQAFPDEAIAEDDSSKGPFLWSASRWYLKRSPGNHHNKAARKATLRALQLVLEDAEPSLIEDALKRDASLTFNILRLANSAAAGLSRPVSSITDAIVLVGRSPIKRWLNLMIFNSNPHDKRREMLLAHAAFRGRSIEQIALVSGAGNDAAEHGFLVGMISMMPLLFGVNAEDIMDDLGANPELRAAVLMHEGSAGALLQSFQAASAGNIPALYGQLTTNGVSARKWNEIMTEAANWALDMTHVVHSG